MKYTVRSSKKHVLELPRKADFNTEFEVKTENAVRKIRIIETWPDGSLRSVMVDGRIFTVEVERRSDGFPGHVRLGNSRYDVSIDKVESTRYRPPAVAKQASGEIRADLPGQVSSLCVTEGQEVRKGQMIGILEAMKMENEIISPRDGVVKHIHAGPGKAVMRGDLLIEIH